MQQYQTQPCTSALAGSHVSRRPARCANVNAWHVSLSIQTSSQAISRLLAAPSSNHSPADAAPSSIQSPADAARLATDAAQPAPSLAYLPATAIAGPPSHHSPADAAINTANSATYTATTKLATATTNLITEAAEPIPSLACLPARLLAGDPFHHSPAITPATDTAEPILSLECLPATAIAAVFQHLDCPSALNLALTCHAYAAEFVQQTDCFMEKCITELAPSLNLDEATDCGARLTKWSQPYDSDMNPVSAHVWWENGRALQRIYALHQQQPDFLQKMWRKAWPKNLWQELCANSLPEYQHILPDITMHVLILIESKEALILPWQWLYEPFMRTFFDAVDGILGQKPGTVIVVSVHRPAAVGKFQEMMLKDFVRGEDGDQWELGRESHYYYPTDQDADMFSEEQQLVAVTGDWCRDRLPSADHPLWQAQQGCTLHPTSVCIEDRLYKLAARNHSGSFDHSRSSDDAGSPDDADSSEKWYLK